MSYTEIEFNQDLVDEAHKYNEFRNKIKIILKDNNLEFDKFTITNRDGFDGYIAEKTFLNYLKKISNPKSIIRIWSDLHNLSEMIVKKIKEYPNGQAFNEEELQEMKIYFYDKWDIEIDGKKIDVKTAATNLIPHNYWTYGIPKIQIEKDGKDFIVLNYLVYDADPKFNKNSRPLKCVLIGFLSIDYIRKHCPILHKNKAAGHEYQIDNYETEIRKYENIKLLVNL